MTGVDILIIVACLVLLLAGERLYAWHRHNEYRKLERLVSRNLHRIGGGR